MQKVKEFLTGNAFVIIMILIVVCNLFVVGFMQASGESMEPTIHDGSFLIVQKAGYTPVRNDIVVAWNGRYPIVKRVVGLPGETVEITEDGKIMVDGKEYPNYFFVSAYIDNAGYVGREITLGEGEYFLIGDNRQNSKDSRMIGPVNRNKIFGKVIFVFDGDGDSYKENAEEFEKYFTEGTWSTVVGIDGDYETDSAD